MGTLLIGQVGAFVGSSKIAAFDLDNTLIKTKSGNKFPQSYKDWQVWDDSVIPKLHKL